MVKDREILVYREKLDRSLALPDLQNQETVMALVRNQLLDASVSGSEGCSDTVVAERANEISSVLNMLRSASSASNHLPKQSAWKLKDDGHEFRVMYRPGPDNSPFHSLLTEGYIDASVDKCLCISWESSLYKKWWPQTTVPPFKVTQSQRLRKLRLGEQISLVRMKAPWPLSAREAVLHYFKLDFFQENMIIVAFNTIPDPENSIPEVKDFVRMDIVGGFVLQKVSAERSFLRTVATTDMKLDFVPPSLINFISRHLLGKGFKLYQKTVTSLTTTRDEEYRKALEDDMYERIRIAMYGQSRQKEEEDANGSCIACSTLQDVAVNGEIEDANGVLEEERPEDMLKT